VSELARPLRLDELGSAPLVRHIAANERERAAIVARLGLVALPRLEAQLAARRVTGGVAVEGVVEAEACQACVLSGDPVMAAIREAVAVRFLREGRPGAEEVELSAEELDVLPLEGSAIDLGELAVQTLALALPAFPRSDGPGAQAARALLLSEEEAAAQAEADRRAAGPLGGLARRG
jgi:uncharacterized metal-binding protein YceD (DUF177 family)